MIGRFKEWYRELRRVIYRSAYSLDVIETSISRMEYEALL